MKNNIRKIIGFLMKYFFGNFKIQPNKIMFETGVGEIKDNPKAFYDYLKKNNISDYNLKWAVNRGSDIRDVLPEEVVYKKTFSYYYHMATSKYWIRSHSVSCILKKRPEQVYIQLWHGPGAIKKQGYDIGNIPNNGETMEHAREWDFFIATDEDNKRFIETALNLKVPRILLGSCRSDCLVSKSEIDYKEVRSELGIGENEIAILYAPTFREEDFHKENIEINLKKLCNMEGVRLILRLHPEVKKRIDMSTFSSSVIDGNKYPDIYDLYVASDIMIADYSSVAIEYSIFKKPILYYMYDLESYMKERNFYYDYLNHLAGPILETEDEVIDAINRIDDIKVLYADKYKEYYEKYNGLNDGHVCERLYKLLKDGYFDHINNKVKVYS